MVRLFAVDRARHLQPVLGSSFFVMEWKNLILIRDLSGMYNEVLHRDVCRRDCIRYWKVYQVKRSVVVGGKVPSRVIFPAGRSVGFTAVPSDSATVTGLL